jgi:hypothetical protein
MRGSVATIIFTSWAATLCLAQTPPQMPARDVPRVSSSGSAVIAGLVVTDDESRAPVRRAKVTLSRAGLEEMRVVATDDHGQFKFDALPAGVYTLAISKGGFVGMNYGAPKPGMPGRSITLAEGQAADVTPIAVMRGAVIGGRVLDRDGRPVESQSVTAVQVFRSGGELRRRSGAGASGTAATNAHGEFRIFGLAPGEYVVYADRVPNGRNETTATELSWAAQPTSTPPPPPRLSGYAPTFFPGTADPAAAVPIALEKGQERLGIDLALQYVPLARITGVVTGIDGRPFAGATVLRMPKRPNPLFQPSFVTILSTSGAFGFPEGVSPGDWLILARGPSTGNGALWGTAELSTAGNDVPGLAIQLQPGVTISGRVDARALLGTPVPDFTRVQIRVTSINPFIATYISPSAYANADGTFTISGVVPGLWKMTVTIGGSATGAGPWFVRSATLDGRDLLDVPIEVRPAGNVSGAVVALSDTRSELSGQLTDQEGKPASQLYVTMFSTDRTHWSAGSRRVASIRASDAGVYSLSGLPAGEYYLCASTEFETDLQFDPAYLDQFVPMSIKLTIADGEKKQQNLQIGR